MNHSRAVLHIPSNPIPCIAFVLPYVPVPFYIYPLLPCIVFILPYIPVPLYIYPVLLCIVFVLPYIPVRFYIYPLLPCNVFVLPYIPVRFYIYSLLLCIVFVLPYIPLPFFTYPLLLVSFLICTRISWCQSTYTPLALKWMDQHQSVVVNGLTSDPQSISFGVPQGSLIGLLLFIIYIIDLPSVVKHCKILFYADDTLLLYVSCSSMTDIEFMLSEDLKNIIECGLIITSL